MMQPLAEDSWYNCDECGASLIPDGGFYVCTTCGLVKGQHVSKDQELCVDKKTRAGFEQCRNPSITGSSGISAIAGKSSPFYEKYGIARSKRFAKLARIALRGDARRSQSSRYTDVPFSIGDFLAIPENVRFYAKTLFARILKKCEDQGKKIPSIISLLHTIMWLHYKPYIRRAKINGKLYAEMDLFIYYCNGLGHRCTRKKINDTIAEFGIETLFGKKFNVEDIDKSLSERLKKQCSFIFTSIVEQNGSKYRRVETSGILNKIMAFIDRFSARTLISGKALSTISSSIFYAMTHLTPNCHKVTQDDIQAVQNVTVVTVRKEHLRFITMYAIDMIGNILDLAREHMQEAWTAFKTFNAKYGQNYLVKKSKKFKVTFIVAICYAAMRKYAKMSPEHFYSTVKDVFPLIEFEDGFREKLATCEELM